MGRAKPLKPEEIENLIVRSAFDFEGQSLEIRGKQKYLSIPRKCLSCGETNKVSVMSVRSRIKSTGERAICRKCADATRYLKPLKPEEIEDPVIRSAFDFQNQTLKRGKSGTGTARLYIPRKCLSCSTVKKVPIYLIRARGVSGICRSCTQKSVRKKGRESNAWKGGRRVNRQGYILVYEPEHPRVNSTKCILEHRLVMEKHLGRYLSASETVHHRNGVRDDNRIENLELWSKNHGTGGRFTDIALPDLEIHLLEIQALIKAKKQGLVGK